MIETDVCIGQKARKISEEDTPGEGIFWIEECVKADAMGRWLTEHPEGQTYAGEWYEPGRGLHLSINAFLFIGSEETLLFDTLSPAVTEHVMDELDRLLDGRDLDYIVLSHDEAPHGGNTHRLLEEFPEATLIGGGRGSPAAEIHSLENAERVAFGDSIDLGGYTVEFIEPVFMDSPVTVWMYERTTGLMCTVDSFGFPHYPSDCVKFEDEMETEMEPNQMMQYNGRSLQWLEFVDPEKVYDQLKYHLEKYEPSIIAPAHGQLIREDIQQYAEYGYECAKRLSEDGALLPLFLTVKDLESLDAADESDAARPEAAGGD